MRRPAAGRLATVLAALAGAAALSGSLSGCGTLSAAPPTCRSSTGLGLVAQAVPSASYVPCVAALPQGWRATALDVADGHARFDLVSDRSPIPVRVELTESCDATGATETTARAAGVRSMIRLRSVDPRYAGTLFDIFPGGCIQYTFDFQRGPHIAFMEEFQGAAGLYGRGPLIADLTRRLGIRVDP